MMRFKKRRFTVIQNKVFILTGWVLGQERQLHHVDDQLMLNSPAGSSQETALLILGCPNRPGSQTHVNELTGL